MATTKKTNNDLRNITHKTKDRVTRTPLSYMCSIVDIKRKLKDATIQVFSTCVYNVNTQHMCVSGVVGKSHNLDLYT